MSQQTTKNSKHVNHAAATERRKKSVTTNTKAVFSALRAPLSKLLARRNQLLNDIKDMSYFGISPKDVKLDSKSQTSVSLGGRELALIDEEIKVMRAAVQAAIGSKGFNARLWYYPVTYASSTGGNFSISISLNPVICPEWASFIALFDLYRVSHVIAHFKVTGVKTVASSITIPYAMLSGISACSYTPIAVTLYTAATQLLDDEKHHIVNTRITGQAIAGTNLAYSADWSVQSDLHSFRMKMPAPGIVGTSSTTNPGDWHPTTDTTDIEGYFNLFSPGYALCDIYSDVIYEYEVEFRCRN